VCEVFGRACIDRAGGAEGSRPGVGSVGYYKGEGMGERAMGERERPSMIREQIGVEAPTCKVHDSC
jgi:hypothetical protein